MEGKAAREGRNTQCLARVSSDRSDSRQARPEPPPASTMSGGDHKC
jgi:hypothetical protein